jgi:putative hydrolase of the HAD superfamily
MDGTLLDRHFDDHFWEEHLPIAYADQRGLGLEEAKEELFGLYRAQEGTLNWTDIDFWSDELGLDIPVLKRQVAHLIAVHPFVPAFLDRVRIVGKEVWLVTNAHGKTLDLKMGQTALAGRFHRIFTSQDIGAPKEDLLFWQRLREKISFDPARTLLADDTVAVLETAERFGIRFLVQVARFSSTRPPAAAGRFFSVEWFHEIMP